MCHMGDIEYFGQRYVLACHFPNTVPLHGEYIILHPSKGIVFLSTSDVIFTVVWSTYAFVTKGEGVMLRCEDVLAHSL